MRKRIHVLLSAVFLLTNTALKAQEISIANISRTSAPVLSSIEVSGSGFGSVNTDIEVWFGASKGVVESVSDYLIVASVPPGATTAAITVINKATGLVATSSQIFYETYQGDTNLDYTNLDNYNFSNSKELFDLVMVDLDQDGKNDVVASKIDNTATDFVVYRNVNNGSNIDFVEQNISLGTPTSRVAAGDIDGDGLQDVILSRAGSTNRFEIFVLRNTSTGPGVISFAAPKSYFLRQSQFAKKIVIKDLNLDGKPEVVVSNTSDDEVSIFVNNSTQGNINLSSTPTRFNIGSVTGNDLIIEDFNNDGKQDIAVTQFSAADVFILQNASSSGSLQFESPLKFTVNGNLNNMAAGDLNSDGKTDIAIADPLDGKLWILINESTNAISFANVQEFASNAGSASVALADIIGNDRLDILLSSSGGDFTIFENTSTSGSLNLTKKTIPQTNSSVNLIAGDLSSDAKPDVALTVKSSTGSFFLKAVRNNNCIAPEILGNQTPTFCNGQTYQFITAPSPGSTFIWKKNNVEVKNSTEPFYDATVAGDFTVSVVSEAGACTMESPIVTLTLKTGTIPNDPVATNNGPACIDGTITLQSTAVTGATSYIWSGPLGFTSTDQNPVLTNVTAEMAGVYSVVAVLGDCQSMSGTTIVEVISPPDLTVSLSGSTRLCTGESVTLTVGAASNYSYQWYKDGTVITGGTNNSYTTTEAGSFTVNLKGISNTCDLTSNPVTVEAFTAPTPVFTTSTTLCTGTAISFTESTAVESGLIPSYGWDFGDSSPLDNTQNPTHTYSAAGQFSVTLTMGYENHTCTNFTSQMITISNPTTFTIQVTGTIPFCDGDSVLLEVPMTGLSSAVWSDGTDGFATYTKVANTISVEATNTAGCLSTDQLDITTLPRPVITATADPEIISLGQSSQLDASGADTYIWRPGVSLSDSTVANPLANPLATITYTVIGRDIEGCLGRAQILVSVEDTGNALPVDAPRLFSPNNDGIDDLWIIANIQNFPDCALVIFSRNGKTVFESRGYNNDWNGIDSNGNELPEGAYFYTISCPDGKTASGSVSIIR